MKQSRQVTTRWDTILGLLEDVINQAEEQHTTLLVCSSKDEFLHQLTVLMHTQHRNESEQNPESNEQDDVQSTKKPHHLLIPTLHLLSASQNIKLVFCSTITIFRAHISYSLKPESRYSSNQIPSKLLVLNLLSLHHGTSEFSLQGLSRTVASLVSTAYRTNHHLQLVECKDAQDLTNPDRGSALWDAQIPLLSGSVKISAAGASWAKRSISVRKVMERWFEFEDQLQP